MRGMMKSFTIWSLFAALLSHQLFASVASIRFEDEKTYYPPPSGTPPSHTQDPSTPSYPPPSNCGSPPYDPSTPPSKTPTPKTPSPKTPSHTPTPKNPSHTPTPSHPSTPSNLPSGGYYSSSPLMMKPTNSDVCTIPCALGKYWTYECNRDCREVGFNFKNGYCHPQTRRCCSIRAGK